MFEIDNDMTIHVTRGDVAFFAVSANNGENKYKFQPGDVVRIKVMQRKNCDNVAFHKDFLLHEETESVNILLTEEETKIGETINKATDYWYEVELNPYTNPQTIIGYDADGPKIFKLYPEGRDLGANVEKADIPVVDQELSLTSERPIANQAVARALVGYDERVALAEQRINETADETEQRFSSDADQIVENARTEIANETDSAVARVQEASEETISRSENAAKRAEDAAGIAQAVASFEIDTEINPNSYNPIANKAVAESFFKRAFEVTLQNADIKEVAENLEICPLDSLTRLRIYQPTSAPFEYGDFYITVDKINTPEYMRVTAKCVATNRTYEMTKAGGTWGAWEKVTTATDLANYLPKTGGTVDGNMTVGTNTETENFLRVRNSKHAITLMATVDGRVGLYSNIHGWLTTFSLDGNTKTFNGTASGNLPLTGGKLTSLLHIVDKNTVPLILEGTHPGNLYSFIQFRGNNTTLGLIGFNGADTPVFESISDNKKYELHHDGNSAKVHLGTTAPNDTTGNVLFINTGA